MCQDYGCRTIEHNHDTNYYHKHSHSVKNIDSNPQFNSKFMKLAIKEAWRYQLLTYPNPAVGSCIVRNNEVLSIEAHHEAGLPHAEVNALKSAYLTAYPNSKLKHLENSNKIHDFLINSHNNFFKDCEIYVTLEPCNHIGKTPACAILLESIKIKKVIIGILDPNKTASGGKKRLEDTGIEVEVLNDTDCNNLLLPFIKWQKRNFKFFKIAMREDGSITGGYITTQDSLNLVHNIRTKIDLMIIGGETVRTDRPTLDARFALKNISPNILIYSNSKNIDKTIPLFSVKNRKVIINNNLELLNKNNFVMIEGGYNLLKNIKNEIDCLILFISHKEKKNKQFNIETLGFKKVYSYMLNQFDEIVFLFKLS